MAKFKEEEVSAQEKIRPSQEMIDSIKKEIGTYETYWEFLYAVQAMTRGETQPNVLEFEKAYFNEYQNTFVKKHFHSSDDPTVFYERTNKRVNIAPEGKPNMKETGFFCPRIFWDFIEHEKMSYDEYKKIKKPTQDDIRSSIQKAKKKMLEKTNVEVKFADVVEKRNESVDYLTN